MFKNYKVMISSVTSNALDKDSQYNAIDETEIIIMMRIT
jgi:hypothetical protein